MSPGNPGRSRCLWDHGGVSAVGIVGAGRAATLHAEAVRATRGARLAGVAATSTDSPRAVALAGALDCPVLTMRELARACDVAVIATPPAVRAGALVELASSRRLRAVLVESPAATTLDGVAAVGAAFADRPIMAGANLLHAPAVRLVLDAIAAMDPHHLELRLAVPDPARGSDAAPAFGGGVTMDPATGFWPVLMAALGAAVERVAAPRVEVTDGLDRAVEVVLQAAGGRTARAGLRWGARVAEAAVEAADPEHAVRVDVWPAPTAEIDGVPAGPPPGASNPMVGLGFTAQIERLVRADNGEAQPWPGLAVAAAALTVSAAAALSARRNGVSVRVADVPRHLSPFEILNS